MFNHTNGVSMRLTVPQIEISRKEGFSEEKDIFGRKQFGEKLANLFENSEDEIVVALDAPWGEGKSTFAKMWQGYVESQRENSFKTVYFDAFANDYQKDPFLALAAEIYELLKDEDQEKKEEFTKKASDAIKSMTRGAIKIGVKAVTGGFIEGTVVDAVEKDISTMMADQVDKMIADKLKSSAKDKLALKHFRDFLQEVALIKGSGNPIIFIIDELDRCRPDFALELIEQIKHIFSVPKIAFLLVLNRQQLEASVKARYGSDVNASLYMQKFVSLWLMLPRSAQRYDDYGEKYLRLAFKSMLSENENFQNKLMIETLIELVKLNKTSYREIERILSYVAIVHNMSNDTKYYEYYQAMIAFVCYLKASQAKIYNQLSNVNLTSHDLLNECNFFQIDSSEYSNLSYMKEIIEFDLADDATRRAMAEKNNTYQRMSFSGYGKQLLTIYNMLQTLERK